MCVCVYVCVCVCVCSCTCTSVMTGVSFQPNGVRSFLGSGDILAGPHYVARLFEG